MTECKYCETNKRSRLTTYTFQDKTSKVCKSCYKWLYKIDNSKKQWIDSSTRGE